jgi:hypothetical protein
LIQAYGIIDYSKVEHLLKLVKESPLCSMCALVYVHVTLTDSAFNTKSQFLLVLPSLFQIVVTAIANHPFHHQDCFHLLQVCCCLIRDILGSNLCLYRQCIRIGRHDAIAWSVFNRKAAEAWRELHGKCLYLSDPQLST